MTEEQREALQNRLRSTIAHWPGVQDIETNGDSLFVTFAGYTAQIEIS